MITRQVSRRREFTRTAGGEDALERAKAHGWTIVSVKDDREPSSRTRDVAVTRRRADGLCPKMVRFSANQTQGNFVS
jgi:hypothetical protein